MSKNHILGVDVGSGAVKALAATIDDNGKIIVKGSAAVPAKGIDKGVITDNKALATAVREAIDCVKMAAETAECAVYLSLGGVAVVSGNSIGSVGISGVVSEQDIKIACRAATAAAVGEDCLILHVLPAKYWLDGNKKAGVPLGIKGLRLDVEAHIVTISKTEINNFTEELNAKGIQAAGFMANSIVGAEVLAANYGMGNCLVLDIGAGLTDITLYENNNIIMSASIPLGGDYITGDIAQGLSVTFEQAESIKQLYAKLNKRLFGQDVMLDGSQFGAGQIPYDFLSKIVECRVEEIISLLYDYLKPAFRDYQPDRIILTGGCAMLPCVAENVEKLFGVPVNLAKPEGLSPEYVHPSIAACFGLLNYTTRLYPVAKPADNSNWRNVLRKLKNFI